MRFDNRFVILVEVVGDYTLVVHDCLLLLGVLWAAAFTLKPGQHVGAVPYAGALEHPHRWREGGSGFGVFDALVCAPADECEHFGGSE